MEEVKAGGDQLFDVSENTRHRTTSPTPWVEPKRRGRPRKRPLSDPAVLKRPRGRPRKVALGSSAS